MSTFIFLSKIKQKRVKEKGMYQNFQFHFVDYCGKMHSGGKIVFEN